MTIQTERLTLRRPQPSDWHAFHEFMTSDRAASLGGPHTAGKAWRQFASELGHWEIFGYGMWSVTKDDVCIGMIGPWTPVDWPEKEIGWMMFAANLEGTGIATEAAAAAVNHAFTTLGWQTAVSYIDPANTRSIRLAEKLGATRDDAATAPDAYPAALVYRHPKPQDARS